MQRFRTAAPPKARLAGDQAPQRPSPAEAAPRTAAPQVDPPLERGWVVHCTKPAPKTGGRGAGPPPSKPVAMCTFRTIRTMWGCYDCLPTPGNMAVGSDLHLFQEGIEPTWECEANTAGGRWTYLLDGDSGRANDCWEALVLALVGETLDPAFHVCGIAVGRRANRQGEYLRVSIWTRDRADDQANLEVGRRAHATAPHAKLEYQDHRAGYDKYRHVLEPQKR